MRTTDFGDDKDRVLIKSDGELTYFASDTAYYLNKRARGFDHCIYLLGADHHGYVGRLRAMAACVGDDPDVTLDVLIGQLVKILQGGAEMKLSKRAGTIVTLDELAEEIGVDALRYSLARYPADSPLVLDVAEITKASNDNPVYYVQYAHARTCRMMAQRRRPRDVAARRLRPVTAVPRARRRPAAGARRVPRVVAQRGRAAGAAPGRALPRGARRRPSTVGTTPRSAGCCPQGDAPVTPANEARLMLVVATRDRHRQRARPARRLRSRSGCEVGMRAHEAGWAHAAVSVRGPAWLREPEDPNALVPQLWSRTARKVDGALEVGGVRLTDLVAEHGSPAYVLDEEDFRARARAFRDGFADCDVYYAGKAFLCTTVARWIAEEGLSLDVCSGGELAVAERAGFPMDRVGFHGNNKTVAELSRAVELGVGRIVVDSFHEIERLVALVAATRPVGSHGRREGDGPGDRGRRGAHPRVHRHRPRGPEVRLLDQQRRRAGRRRARSTTRPGLELLGLHSHIGSQIFDSSGFEVAARRVLALHAQISSEIGVELPELDLGGGFGIAYTTQDDPSDAAQLAIEMTKIVRDECKARDLEVPRLSIEPGRAIAGPAMCTVYEVGTVKAVELDGGAVRTYVSVDGGMSDNIRTALYDADYSCTLANRASDAPALMTRLVGKHCEAGDIIVKDEFLPGDVAPGDLVAVPGHRRLLPVDGQQLQPRPAAAGGRRARRRVPGRRTPRDAGRPARHRPRLSAASTSASRIGVTVPVRRWEDVSR